MRTTLDLEEAVLEGLKSLQKKEKLPLGKIASRLLTEALARETAGESAPASLKWISAPMHAKVDITDKESFYRIPDERGTTISSK
jgi:hypothetical protein